MGIARGDCNEGTITGEGLRVEDNNCYLTQLHINVSDELIIRSVRCLRFYENTTTSIIGERTISIISGILCMTNKFYIPWY